MNAGIQRHRKPLNRPLSPAVLFSYALVGLMLACLAYAMNHILARIFPTWDGWYIPLLTFFVAIQAAITYRQLRQSVFTFGEWALWRITEWVVLAVLLKLAVYILQQPSDLLADLQRWQEDFLVNFFTDAYIITLGLSLVVWFAANTFAEVLFDLEENKEEWDLERQGVAVKNREKIRQGLMAHVFGYGVLMLVVTAFLNLEISFLPESVRGLTINTLVFVLYFVFGLILLAQSQFSVLRARWYLLDIPSSPMILTRWLRYSILLVLVIAVIVILLPTQYAVGFFALLQGLLSVVMFIGLILQFLILTPFYLLLSFLARLFGNQDLNMIPEQMPPQPPSPPPTGGTFSWLDTLQSILFWVLFLAVIFLSFRFYFRQHEGIFTGLSQTGPLRWARRFWRWLLSVTGSVGQKMQQAVQAGFERARYAGLKVIAAIPGQDPVIARLPPRQQVLVTYLTMIIWLRQNGVERKKSSTPHEYARQLTAILPESYPEIEGITHLFIEARYSTHPISDEQSREARSLWERIRQRYLLHLEQQDQITNEIA